MVEKQQSINKQKINSFFHNFILIKALKLLKKIQVHLISQIVKNNHLKKDQQLQQFQNKFYLFNGIVMEKATKEIIEIVRGQLVYYLSVIEKQNNSGIMFNQRIFFLLSGHHIGYLSQVQMSKPASNIHFQKVKKTILITDIKSLSIKDKVLTIKFVIIESHQDSERDWILRMESQQLAFKWYEMLQREKMNAIKIKQKEEEEEEEEEQIRQIKQVVPEVNLQNQRRNKQQKRGFQIVNNVQLSFLEKKTFQQIGLNVKSTYPQRINDNLSNQSILLQKMKKIVSPSKGNNLPWTYKYIKFNYLIFNDFKVYTRQIMEEIIQPKPNKKYTPKMIKDGIYYFDINDLQVKIATIDLEKTNMASNNSNQQRVSSKKAIKALQNEFNMFMELYQYLQNYPKLRVPLVNLCEYYGFIALFKVISKSTIKPLKQYEIQTELNLLKSKYQIKSNSLILLDQQYYESLKEEGDQQLNFNCYFIEETMECTRLNEDLDKFIEQQTLSQEQNFNNIERSFITQNSDQMEKTRNKSTNLSKLKQQQQSFLLANTIFQMNSLKLYFINSSEFSEYLHQKGINIRFLGQIYSGLKTSFQCRFVMTQISARSCKSLFRKTMQDQIMDQGKLSKQELFILVCDFLNCVLGNTYETTAIWKVLSAHSQFYFGVSIDFDEIDKGYFLISLIQNCRLDVIWQQLNPEEAFKTNIFFSNKNLKGLLVKHKTYSFVMNKQYRTVHKILDIKQNQVGFQKILRELNLKTCALPYFFSDISSKIKKYLTYFINPEMAELEYHHLHIFECIKTTCPSRVSFEIHLIAIKWWLKLQNRQKYISACDDFIKLVTHFFGEFHPIFSELYNVFSVYHLGLFEYQDAINFAKSSLINILKLLGLNNQRTSEQYYHIGLCYMAASYDAEAIMNIKKSLQILEQIGQSQSISYSIMCIKLGYLYLNKNQIENSLTVVSHALQILQDTSSQNQHSYQQKIIECYQIMTQCFSLLKSQPGMLEMTAKSASKLKEIKNCNNVSKMIKITLYPLLRDLSIENSTYLINWINVLPKQMDYQTAYNLIVSRIEEQSLIKQFRTCLNQLITISKAIKSQNSLKKQINNKNIQESSITNDNSLLMTQLLVFLGQQYFLTTLK